MFFFSSSLTRNHEGEGTNLLLQKLIIKKSAFRRRKNVTATSRVAFNF
jgi:hypothetical protein